MAASTTSLFIEVIGWAGSISILAAYALLSSGRVRSQSWVYQLMNVAGALGMAINGWAHAALPSVFNNVIWLSIGAIALGRLVGRRKRT
jgi:hypothetical protein